MCWNNCNFLDELDLDGNYSDELGYFYFFELVVLFGCCNWFLGCYGDVKNVDGLCCCCLWLVVVLIMYVGIWVLG